MQIFGKLNLLKEYRRNQEEKENLLALIDEARQRIGMISRGFDMATGNDLVDYYIYEKRATELNYSYLLKQYADKNYNMEKPTLFHTSALPKRLMNLIPFVARSDAEN